MIQAVVVIGIALFIAVLILLANYNSLKQLRQEVRSAWAEMDQQLKNRYDLIPNLVANVQSIGGEPANKLPAITTAKNQAAIAYNPAQLAIAETALTIAIRDLLKVAEQDAGFNASARFVEICRQVIASEKQIDSARRRYNDSVENLNASLGSFPTSVTAKLAGVRPRAMFREGRE